MGSGRRNLGRALRLRWLWIAWTQPRRPWNGFPIPCDQGDRSLFASATKVTIGNGRTARFWTCNWLGNEPLCSSFPLLFKHSRRKNRTVAEALANDQWIRDLQHGNLGNIVLDFIRLWRQIREHGGIFSDQQPDSIRWTKSSSGIYSTDSAYKLQLSSTASGDLKSTIWKAWAPGRIKIFSWLLHQDRLWCNDRLQRRGWENGYFCQFCMRNLETSVHLFWNCHFSRAIWNEVATWKGCRSLLLPSDEQTNTNSAVKLMITQADRAARKGVKTMIMMISWELWNERNNCIFRAKTASSSDIIAAVRRCMEQWRLAGAKAIETPFGDHSVR